METKYKQEIYLVNLRHFGPRHAGLGKRNRGQEQDQIGLGMGQRIPTGLTA